MRTCEAGSALILIRICSRLIPHVRYQANSISNIMCMSRIGNARRGCGCGCSFHLRTSLHLGTLPLLYIHAHWVIVVRRIADCASALLFSALRSLVSVPGARSPATRPDCMTPVTCVHSVDGARSHPGGGYVRSRPAKTCALRVPLTRPRPWSPFECPIWSEGLGNRI